MARLSFSENRLLFIRTYGCQANIYDSDRMEASMKAEGYSLTLSPDNADMIIINTCHIREKAAEKMYSELGRMRILKEMRKKLGKRMIIAIAGCVGQAEGEEIFKRAPYVDVIVGPQSYHNLPVMVKEIEEKHQKKINLDFPLIPKFDLLPPILEAQGVSSFLSIQEGCDKMCSFCCVPYTRGAEYSRPVSSIYREAMQMIETGVKEITLLGQNVNGYHGESEKGLVWNLGQLVMHLSKIKGLERIRYTTSHPLDMHEELYEAHATEKKLMPFLHLPVQSGSDKVLKEMNRRHTRDTYYNVIDKLRNYAPSIGFSSDFIVGFPGETEEDFQATMELIAHVKYHMSYSFGYSPRPGTPAAERADQVESHIKLERLYRLQEVLNAQQHNFNQTLLHTYQPVLLEKEGKHPGQMMGKTPYMQPVHVYAEEKDLGSIVSVYISEITSHSLKGHIAPSAIAA